MRFLKSALFSILILSAYSLAFGGETYRGTISHSPSGMSSDVYLRKDKDGDRGSLQTVQEMMDTINAIEKFRNERERLEMEREKLQLLKERNEIERKRLEQEQKKTDYSEKQYDQGTSYRNSYSPASEIQKPSATDSQQIAKPFNVYLRNGKVVLCDYAWRDRNSIFLVHHGKKFAVGYADSEIELEKSFR